jgi:hypothetical protein
VKFVGEQFGRRSSWQGAQEARAEPGASKGVWLWDLRVSSSHFKKTLGFKCSGEDHSVEPRHKTGGEAGFPERHCPFPSVAEVSASWHPCCRPGLGTSLIVI